MENEKEMFENKGIDPKEEMRALIDSAKKCPFCGEGVTILGEREPQGLSAQGEIRFRHYVFRAGCHQWKCHYTLSKKGSHPDHEDTDLNNPRSPVIALSRALEHWNRRS